MIPLARSRTRARSCVCVCVLIGVDAQLRPRAHYCFRNFRVCVFFYFFGQIVLMLSLLLLLSLLCTSLRSVVSFVVFSSDSCSSFICFCGSMSPFTIARAHTHNIFVAISFIPFGVCLTYHAHYFGYFSFLSLIAFANLNAGAACITFLHITTCRVISISSLTLLFFILSLLVYRYVLFRFFCHSTCCPIRTVQCAQYLRYFMLISSYFLVDLPAFKWFPLERFYSIVVRIDHSKHTSTQNSSR